ncbi:alpha-L-fucosidase [Massilia sp. UMI-21]|nr:alpha-L-fucosidase [Massilia sp. UMI-21]
MTTALVLGSALAHGVEPPKPDPMGVPPSKLYDYGSMGPPATPEVVQAAIAGLDMPPAPGPFQPTWKSIAAHYRTPDWFKQAQFGLFIHWGLYSVAAHRNEWYEKHMYSSAESAWHAEHFGPHERFGYKDLIPRFTARKFDPDAWAALFKAAGARFVMPAAQHHDNFALWDSRHTPFNAKAMGPRRDLIGELGVAVRKQGMKYGLGNHGVENFTFINPTAALETRLRSARADLFDPAWSDFYNVADRSPAAMARFLTNWTERNFELIDKYQPDILWFDNGANLRVLDPLKLRVAAYYYNRAADWGKQVSISSKYVAYAPSNDDSRQIGSIIDFEKVGRRSPPDIRPGPWMVDDNLGSTWGYTEGMSVAPMETILRRLVDTVAKGGTYLLNISPRGDGSIPDDQKQVLLALGAWLEAHGEAIYASTPWKQYGEGEDIRFTRKGEVLYAIVLNGAGPVRIAALASGRTGRIAHVELLGENRPVSFRQDAQALSLEAPQAGVPRAYRIRFH